MANLPISIPTGSSNPVKVRYETDETGAVYVQVVQIGTDDQGRQIVDLLTLLLAEMRALRLTNSQAFGVNFEPAENLS